MENHTGSGIPHHRPDTLPHVRPVAMDPAFGTRRLIRRQGAPVQPPPGVFNERPALRAGHGPFMVSPAVKADHLFHQSFLRSHRIPVRFQQNPPLPDSPDTGSKNSIIIFPRKKDGRYKSRRHWFCLELAVGFEPTTCALRVHCSTPEPRQPEKVHGDCPRKRPSPPHHA